MFNYKKLAVAQSEAKAATQALSLAKELYERLLSDRDAELLRLRNQVDAQHGKISLMETILMPLSSRAGAAYQDARTPREKPATRPNIEPPTNEWLRYKRAKEAELEKEYAAEDQK